MKVLVTGANGHIGSHVVRELLAHNHQVRAFVRATADLQGIDGLNIEKVYGDVQQYETLENTHNLKCVFMTRSTPNKKPAIKAGFFYWRFRDESSARFSNVMIDGCVEL